MYWICLFFCLFLLLYGVRSQSFGVMAEIESSYLLHLRWTCREVRSKDMNRSSYRERSELVSSRIHDCGEYMYFCQTKGSRVVFLVLLPQNILDSEICVFLITSRRLGPY